MLTNQSRLDGFLKETGATNCVQAEGEKIKAQKHFLVDTLNKNMHLDRHIIQDFLKASLHHTVACTLSLWSCELGEMV